MQENIIEVNNLTLAFAFTNFSINFKRNSLIAISGASNCGKTTLIRVLSRKITTENTVKLCGEGLEFFQVDELNKFIKTIIPDEISFNFQTLKDELLFQLDGLNLSYKDKEKKLKELLSEYKLTRYKDAEPNSLPYFIKLKLTLLKSLIARPNILLLDDVLLSLTKSEKEEVLALLSVMKKHLTIILTTSNLKETLSCDYLYIIDESSIVLEGNPQEVLVKDNILNKIGLEVPFMIDLSVKLQDYNLLTGIELDMNRLVETLWK